MKTRKIALIVSSLVLLVGMTAAGCDDKGTVIDTRIYGGVGEKCDLTIRPDGVDENGDVKAPFKIKERRSQDCKRCPKGARWPDCMKNELPNGMGRIHL
jgi:hypothetical protein